VQNLNRFVLCHLTREVVLTDTVQVTGRTADVILAAHTAAEVALRSLKIGKKVCGLVTLRQTNESCVSPQNNEVSELISKATAEFKCNPVVGVLSHQVCSYN